MIENWNTKETNTIWNMLQCKSFTKQKIKLNINFRPNAGVTCVANKEGFEYEVNNNNNDNNNTTWISFAKTKCTCTFTVIHVKGKLTGSRRSSTHPRNTLKDGYLKQWVWRHAWRHLRSEHGSQWQACRHLHPVVQQSAPLHLASTPSTRQTLVHREHLHHRECTLSLTHYEYRILFI